ncbi:sensor histidine kinase [Ancylomarina salipaludis]|nr:HAMP domain-containing sensor histidine kinase [Ancylomarina salipaludis]
MNSVIQGRLIICLLILFISAESLFAQRTVFSMYEYNKENGLPEELVKDVIADRQGIPYFATDNGLYALIHNEFHRVPIAEGKSSYFKAFFSLNDQSILVVSDDAIYKLISGTENARLELFIECNKGEGVPEYPKNIYQDSKNRIWIADHSNIFSYANGKLTKYKMDEKNKSDSYLRSYQFMELDQGQIMVVSQRGWFYKFNEDLNVFGEMNYEAKFLVNTLFLYKSNEFILGTSKGLMNFKYASNGDLLEEKVLDPYIVASCMVPLKRDRFLVGTWFQGLLEVSLSPNFNVYPAGGFPSFSVNNMYRDYFGCVWAASNSGIVHLETEFFSTQLLNQNTDWVRDFVTNEKGIYFLNPQSVCRVYPDYSVETVLEFDTNNSTKLGIWKDLILVGNAVGEIRCYKKNRLTYTFKVSDTDVTDIAINSSSEAWVISNYELFRLDLSDGSQSSYLKQFGGNRVVRDVEYLNKNDLVIGGANQDSYLYFYDKFNDSITNASVDTDFMKGKEFWTRDIYIDGDSIFIGTSIGLIKYFDGAVERIDLDDYTGKEISSVTKDSEGHLWLSESRGVIRKSGDELTLFTTKDGLPSKTVRIGNILVDGGGVLWVGTSNGLAYSDIKQKPKKIPKPLLYSIWDGKHILLTDSILNVSKNTTIFFNVSSLSYPQKKNQFEYCIIDEFGGVPDWLPLKTKNQIIISDLKVGDYQFKIRTKHSGNYFWSDERHLTIKVNEVWYLRWYSVVIFVLFLLAIIYLTYLTSKNRAHKRMLNLQRLIDEQTKDLKKVNEELETVNLAKDKFISIIAHDLRNPFNAIRGFSQMLLDHTSVLESEEKNEIIEMIYKSSDDTFKLLENLLDWANLQKGNMIATPESFNLRELMQKNLDVHKKLSAIKKVNIEGEFSDVFVFADQCMIDTVVRNLLSNAIKYSYPEDVIVLETEELDDMAVIRIKDHGVGMSSERIDQLFRIDAISSTNGTSDETGSGFGLMLSKEFVELNGGRIEIQSEKGKGTVFSVYIPLDK